MKIFNKILSKSVLLSVFFYPVVSFAQYSSSYNNLTRSILSFRGLISITVPIIFSLSMIYFFWGTANFILNAGNEKTRRDGINKMIWSVVVLFVFISIWAILGALRNLFNI